MTVAMVASNKQTLALSSLLSLSLLSSLPSPSPPLPPGVSSAEFVCGKAEEVMSEVQLPWVRQGELVGIVDPPRGGLRKNWGVGAFMDPSMRRTS